MILAFVLVVAVIAVIAVVAGRDKPKKKEEFHSDELTADSKIAKSVKKKEPERDPPPDISKEIIEHAKQVVAEAEADRSQGDTLYDEAMTAKQKGDLDTWKVKLKAAKEHFLNILDQWNKIIGDIDGELPTTTSWDAEEVANYHLGKEGEKITKALKKLAFIKKQLGVN